MSTDDLEQFAAEINQNLPTLDLHGLYPAPALDKLEVFLYNNFIKKERALKIIYGIGAGVLEERVTKQLTTHPLVRGFSKQPGYCIVTLEI